MQYLQQKGNHFSTYFTSLFFLQATLNTTFQLLVILFFKLPYSFPIHRIIIFYYKFHVINLLLLLSLLLLLVVVVVVILFGYIQKLYSI